MFFILSKILAFVLKPLNLLAFTAIAAWWTKSERQRRRRLALLLFLFFVFTNKVLVNWAASAWEIGYTSVESIETPYEVGILLGGYANFKAQGPVQNFARPGNRLTTALQLYQQGKIKRILLSGGSGLPLSTDPSEAPEVALWLRSVGVPDSALLIEGRSRNTRENALYSRQMLDSLGLHQQPLLITSAWHLRRSMACFRKVGLHCTPFGTDYFYEKIGLNPFKWIEPDWDALMKWEALIKEWVGYVVYWLKGY